MGPKYYKSYYFAVEGPGLKEKNLARLLMKIADFESLTYEHGAHKTISRLHLLVSTASKPPGGNDYFCMYGLDENQVEVIEDNGHLGCGFVPPELLVSLLGNSVPAERVFAIQVRLVGPFGIAKGLWYQ